MNERNKDFGGDYYNEYNHNDNAMSSELETDNGVEIKTKIEERNKIEENEEQRRIRKLSHEIMKQLGLSENTDVTTPVNLPAPFKRTLELEHYQGEKRHSTDRSHIIVYGTECKYN